MTVMGCMLLLQIRSLLVAQQNAATTLAQAQADKEAQQIAADEKVLAEQNTPSPKRIWRGSSE